MGRSLIFLLSEVKPHQKALSDLAARGHDVYASTNIQKVIEKTLQHRPDMLVISLNHPQNLANKLIQVVEGTSTIAVPAAEKPDPKAVRILDSMPFRYKLHPMLTGPKILRLIDLIAANEGFVERDSDMADDTGVDENAIIGLDPVADNPIVEQIKNLMDEGFAPKDEEWLTPPADLDHAMAFEIDYGSNKELLFALNQSPEHQQAIGAEIQRYLEDNLQKQQQTAKVSKRDVKLADVPYKLIEVQKELRSYQGDQDAFVCSFLPNELLESDFVSGENAEMLGIRAADLNDEIPLPTDIYLFLPKSNKYLKMAREGRTIDELQLRRWQEKGLIFFFPKDQQQEVSDYNLSKKIREEFKKEDAA